MRLLLVSACTFAVYGGAALAQDQQQPANAMEEELSERGVNYARDDSTQDRARNYARDAQRIAQRRQDQGEEEDAPLPLGEAVIVDHNRRSGPDN